MYHHIKSNAMQDIKNEFRHFLYVPILFFLQVFPLSSFHTHLFALAFFCVRLTRVTSIRKWILRQRRFRRLPTMRISWRKWTGLLRTAIILRRCISSKKSDLRRKTLCVIVEFTVMVRNCFLLDDVMWIYCLGLKMLQRYPPNNWSLWFWFHFYFTTCFNPKTGSSSSDSTF